MLSEVIIRDITFIKQLSASVGVVTGCDEDWSFTKLCVYSCARVCMGLCVCVGGSIAVSAL